MAMPNLNEIVTTTLRNRSGQLSHHMTRTNAMLQCLDEFDRKQILNLIMQVASGEQCTVPHVLAAKDERLSRLCQQAVKEGTMRYEINTDCCVRDKRCL